MAEPIVTPALSFTTDAQLVLVNGVNTLNNAISDLPADMGAVLAGIKSTDYDFYTQGNAVYGGDGNDYLMGFTTKIRAANDVCWRLKA